MSLPKRRRGITDLPPTALIDLDSDLAWVNVLALMCWPKDARRRGHVQATFASDLLGWLDTIAPDAADLGVSATTENMAGANGIRPNDLAFMPATQRHFARAAGSPAELAKEVWQRIFKPSGGFKAVADATGTERLVEEFGQAVSGGASMAGRLLLYLAMLRECHGDMGASIARSIAILDDQKRRSPGLPIPSARVLKDMWKEWRGIAPIWAAIHLRTHLHKLPPDYATWEVLLDPILLRQVLAWALWLRDFGSVVRATHSGTPIIPAGEAVALEFGIAPEKPPFEELRLNKFDLQAAQGAGDGGSYRSNPLA